MKLKPALKRAFLLSDAPFQTVHVFLFYLLCQIIVKAYFLV